MKLIHLNCYHCPQDPETTSWKPNTKNEKPPLELLMGKSEIPPTIQAIAVAFGGLPQVEGKTLLSKDHALQTQDLEDLSWNWPESLFPED